MAEPRRVGPSRAGARSSSSLVRPWRSCSAPRPDQRPADGAQEVVFRTPLAIVVLIVGTGWLLWRISRRPPGPPEAMIEPPVRGADPVDHTARTPRGRARYRQRARRGTSSSSAAGSSARGTARRDVARDAAALIEQDDIASGTSSRSSRLIHGGLRYLEQFRFALVREALAERSRAPELAPHLVRIEPLLFPIYGIPFASKAFYDAGLTLYDVLGARHDGGWHRRLSKADTLTSRRRCAVTACAAASSTTTASRTTPATRLPWPGPRSPQGPSPSPGSARPASARGHAR